MVRFIYSVRSPASANEKKMSYFAILNAAAYPAAATAIRREITTKFFIFFRLIGFDGNSWLWLQGLKSIRFYSRSVIHFDSRIHVKDIFERIRSKVFDISMHMSLTFNAFVFKIEIITRVCVCSLKSFPVKGGVDKNSHQNDKNGTIFQGTGSSVCSLTGFS